MQDKATIEPAGSAVPLPPARRNPARRMLGKLGRRLRGDKYMAYAYPPDWQDRAAPVEGQTS